MDSGREAEGLSREGLKQRFRLIPGGKVARQRNPDQLFGTKTIESPLDSETTFTIKKAGVREKIERQNFFSKVRYRQEDESGSDKIVTERDFPMGDLQLLTVELCLVNWNITDLNNQPVPVNHATITKYLDPEELDFLNDEIIKYNEKLWGDREPKKDA
jgi:hypothetical protein